MITNLVFLADPIAEIPHPTPNISITEAPIVAATEPSDLSPIVLAVETSSPAFQTEAHMDISLQCKPQATTSPALEKLNWAKIILNVNPYDFTPSRTLNLMNNDKLRFELSKFLDMLVGGT